MVCVIMVVCKRWHKNHLFLKKLTRLKIKGKAGISWIKQYTILHMKMEIWL